MHSRVIFAVWKFLTFLLVGKNVELDGNLKKVPVLLYLVMVLLWAGTSVKAIDSKVNFICTEMGIGLKVLFVWVNSLPSATYYVSRTM